MITNKIETQLAEAFTRAVQKSHNLYADGTVNWDYVDADMHLECTEEVLEMGPVRYNELFNYLAESHETTQILNH